MNVIVLFKIIERTEEVSEPDLTALELGVRVKEVVGGEVITLSLVSSEEFAYLGREAYARGADRAMFIIDPQAKSSDPYRSASILASTARKVGDLFLLISGEKSADTPSGVVGPMVGSMLGLPTIYFAYKLHEIRKDGLRVTVDLGVPAVVDVRFPCAISASSDLIEPRTPSIKEKMMARKKKVEVLKAEDTPEPFGRLVEVLRPPERERKRVMLRDVEELVRVLVEELGVV